MELAKKDLGLVLAAGADSNVPLPLASLVHQRIQTQLARGRGDWDWSAVGQGAREDAAL